MGLSFADLLARHGNDTTALVRAVNEEIAKRRRDPTRGYPCRDLKRRLLEHLDNGGALSRGDLRSWLESQHCPAGHQLPAGSLAELVAEREERLRLSAIGDEWLLDYGRPAPDWNSAAVRTLPPLRSWQIEALNAWVAHGRHGVIQAVTGTGKSRVGVEAAREAIALDYSVIVCAPTRALVDQWCWTLRESGMPPVGRLTGTAKDSLNTHRILVGTVHSLYRRPPTRADGKLLLIADECHRYGSDEWRAVLDPSYRSRLGLTATLERNDDGIHDLYDYFGGTAVFDIGFRRAIDDGVIARYDVKLVGVSLAGDERAAYDEHDETVRETRHELLDYGVAADPFGEFMKQVADISEQPDHFMNEIARQYLRAFSRRGEVVANARAKMAAIRRLAPSIETAGGTLVFNSRRDACEDIAQVLRDEDVKAEAIHSGKSDEERGRLLRALKARRISALVAPHILDEGIDVPDVDLGVVTAGSSSRREMIQRMGRVLRLKKDGRKATFVVVYARDTTEDLMANDGREGFLNLVTESADSVAYLAAGAL